MILEYHPGKGFKIDSVSFEWSERRDLVRFKLRNEHKEDDRIIELAQFFDGDESKNLHQRRDIYEGLKGERNYFFLGYDEEDRLTELEIHSGIRIHVRTVTLVFGRDIDQFIEELTVLEDDHVEIEDGNHLFKTLKMTAANSESMGGDGNGLAYFYASLNVQHLIEEQEGW